MRRAVSKPSMPGICTSSRITAEVVLLEQRQGLGAGAGADESVVFRRSTRRSGRSAVGAVVDEQKLHLRRQAHPRADPNGTCWPRPTTLST